MSSFPQEHTPPPTRGNRSRQIAGGVLAAVTCAATAGTAVPAAAAPAPVARAGVQATDFGLGAGAFGTEARSDDVNARSAKSAVVVIGCTTQAGLDRTKGVDNDDLGTNGEANGVTSRVWTTQRDGVVASHARSRVDNVGLVNSGVSLGITNLVVETHTWHNRSGFHRLHSFELGGLTGDSAGAGLPGLPAAEDIEPGQEYDIPGVGTMTFDVRSGRATQAGARAFSTGLVVDFLDGTVATFANANSHIDRELNGGVLRGTAQSAYSDDGVLEARNVIKKSVPCQGTDGKWRNASGAATDQPGINSGQSSAGALGDQLGKNRSVARTRAQSSRVSMAAGAVVVTNIKAQANVARNGGTYTRTTAGSDIGKLFVNGQQRAMPDPGQSMRIPGVAVITPQVVTRHAHAITVVGLRVKMLSGTAAGSVYDLARSNAMIRPS